MTADEKTNEDALTSKFCEGDVDALCALFDRYEDLLRRRIDRLLPPAVRRRVSASDILQESRLVALDRREDFLPEGDGAFRKWILGIVEKKARRAVQWNDGVKMRSASRELTKARRIDTGQFVGRSPTPSQVAVAGELRAIARAAMGALSEDHREVLRLVRDQDLSLKDAAREMGRSYDATKKLYGRALANFAATFQEMRGDADGG